MVTLAVTACPPAVTDVTAVQNEPIRNHETHSALYRPQGRHIATLPPYHSGLWNIPRSSSLIAHSSLFCQFAAGSDLQNGKYKKIFIQKNSVKFNI